MITQALPSLTDEPALVLTAIVSAEFPAYRTASGEVVMQDLDIGRALGLSIPVNVRKVIRNNAPELGALLSRQERSSGRTGLVYYLTEEQALFISAKCRTPNATTQLKRLIAVYMEARKGNGAAAVAIAQGVPAPRLSGGDDSLSMQVETIRGLLNLGLKMQAFEEKQQQTDAIASQAAQQSQNALAKVDRLLAENQAAERVTETLRPAAVLAPEITTQIEVNRICRSYGMLTKRYDEAWNTLYAYHRDLYSMDLKQLAKNAGVTPAEMATTKGRWEYLYALALRYVVPKVERIKAERAALREYNA